CVIGLSAPTPAFQPPSLAVVGLLFPCAPTLVFPDYIPSCPIYRIEHLDAQGNRFKISKGR
ncbi:MAG: hypothetical protein K8J31_01025, partial [Anaerolineae bacterium]|nr:hypothetical protein [Anaerolineae bacterium]